MKRFTFCVPILLVAAIVAGQAGAALISVAGPPSSADILPQIIAPPSSCA